MRTTRECPDPLPAVGKYFQETGDEFFLELHLNNSYDHLNAVINLKPGIISGLLKVLHKFNCSTERLAIDR